MNDAQGDLLGRPNGITPAAVIANTNIKVSSVERNEQTQRQSVGHIAQFRTLIPYQLAMNARRLNCNFVDLSQGSLYQ